MKISIERLTVGAGIFGAGLSMCVGCGDTVLTELFAAPLAAPPRIEGNSIVGAFASDFPPSPNPDSCIDEGFPAEPNHIQVFRMINEHRVANGLNPVKYSFRLQESADTYALTMYEGDFFAHVGLDGTQPADRAIDAGYCNGFIGENIAYGRNRLTSPAQVMQAFKDSPVHNENMLQPHWEYVGVGYLRVTRFGVIESWWVHEFGLDLDD